MIILNINIVQPVKLIDVKLIRLTMIIKIKNNGNKKIVITFNTSLVNLFFVLSIRNFIVPLTKQKMLIITPIIPVESTRLLVDDKYFKNFRNKSKPKNSDV